MSELELTALRRAAARAIPLSARARGDLPREGDERADRRLRRWRQQPPFASADWFARRLAADGLSPEQLGALLAESEDSLAERVPAEPWVDWVSSSFESSAPAPEIPKASAFAAPFGPLLGAARRRLLDEVADLSAAPCLGRLAHHVDRSLHSLIADSHRMAERTMILELNVAALRGQLAGDTPGDRFDAFTRRISDPRRAVELLTEYPVLARQVAIAAEQWVATTSALLRRLVRDSEALDDAFGGGRPLGRLVDVRSGLGDRHRGGACVARLTFESGTRVMYKPRSVHVDERFQRLVEWLNPGLGDPLRTITCLPRPGYGWVEHVASEPCPTEDGLRRLHRRSGSLLALLYVLDAIDCHAHNVIVAGDQPIVIDLETLLQPLVAQPENSLSVADQLAHRGAMTSVLRPGMLPHRAWTSAGTGGVDVSALGWRPGQLDPQGGPVAVEAGTDRMRVEYRSVSLDEPGREPVLGRPGELMELLDDLDAGFREAYEELTRRRQELRELIRAFADHETRFLRRDTRDYATLLRSSFHPDLLRDALDRDRHFDRLWALAASDRSVLPFIPPERRDLWNNDIPLFTTRPGDAELVDTDGASLGPLVEAPAIDAALAKIDSLGPADLDRQRWIYRSAISISCADADLLTPAYEPGLGEEVPEARALADRAERGAARVAERLCQLAYRGPGDMAWIGPNMTAQSWDVAPLGPDLYTGTAGIALFLEHLAALTRDPDHREAADAAERTLRMQLDRRAGLLTGGFESAGGVLLALAHLHRLRPDREWEVLADKVLDRVEAIAEDDAAHDVLGGNAGTIGGLVAWHAVRPADRSRRLVRACADQLIRAALPRAHGIGWIPAPLARIVDRPLAGFAHGGSGIAWALTRATALLDDRHYATAAMAALEHERSLFDPAAAGWCDVRATPPRCPTLWCHGAAGVGMSRLAMAGVLDDPRIGAELAIAVDAVVRAGFGHNFSLCHGDLGNLDLLLQVAPLSSAGQEIALRHARAVLDGIDAHGWVCGLPGGIEAPSLMVGLAGIGYGLLRVAAPAAVPSVLVMQVPA